MCLRIFLDNTGITRVLPIELPQQASMCKLYWQPLFSGKSYRRWGNRWFEFGIAQDRRASGFNKYVLDWSRSRLEWQWTCETMGTYAIEVVKSKFEFDSAFFWSGVKTMWNSGVVQMRENWWLGSLMINSCVFCEGKHRGWEKRAGSMMAYSQPALTGTTIGGRKIGKPVPVVTWHIKFIDHLMSS